jgi:DNA-binding NarL/FixJ family response regulator
MQSNRRMEDLALRIMIVDDEPLIALDLEAVLADAGHEVVGHVVTGSDAIRLAEEHRPDLVLMDIILNGDMNGVAAAQAIYDRWAIRSLFVSADCAPYRDGAAPARPFGFLLKPVVPQQLLQALAEVTRQLGRRA